MRLIILYYHSPLRERIKYCCEQLRTLLPYIKGRKNDAASILEATVDYVKYIREKLPPAVMGQVFSSQALEFYCHTSCFNATFFSLFFITGNVCVFVYMKKKSLSK